MTTEKHALNFLERSSRSSSRRRSVDYTMKVIIWEENQHHPIPKKMKPTRTEMLKIPYFSAYSIKWLPSTYCPTLSLCLTLILISHVEAATTFIYLVIFLLPQNFSFLAISQWNTLPNSLKSIDHFRAFKFKLKQHLLAQYGWFHLFLPDGFLRKYD